MARQGALFDDERDAPAAFVKGEVRRALDRDLATARGRGAVFLETEVAAVRRQANDLDRLERILAHGSEVKTWDYNPKTTAHQAYGDAVRRLFGEHDDEHDPFIVAVRELEAAAQARTAAALDTEGSEPAD